MNKRARTRLIAVTAIIVVAIVSIVVFIVLFAGAKGKSVSEVVDDADLVGERVKVSGTVVPGSWDKQVNPMRFEIQDEGEEGGPTIQVVFTGGMPSTFGDGVVAVVTGVVGEGPVIESDEMITKCPSKYEAADDAMSVASILAAKSSMTGITTKITGSIAAGSIQPPGSDVRFTIEGDSPGTLDVSFDGGMPEGVTDGAAVVLQGALEDDGVFVATSVSLAQGSE